MSIIFLLFTIFQYNLSENEDCDNIGTCGPCTNQNEICSLDCFDLADQCRNINDSVILICLDGNPCAVNCIMSRSCEFITVIGPNSESLTVNGGTNGQQAMRTANISAPMSTDVTINCNYVDQCDNMYVKCGIGKCEITCDTGYDSPCSNTIIDASLSSNFICNGNCTDVLNNVITTVPSLSPTTFTPPPTTGHPTTQNPSQPSISPTNPSSTPTTIPTSIPTMVSTANPTYIPTLIPIHNLTSEPTTNDPTYTPSNAPTVFYNTILSTDNFNAKPNKIFMENQSTVIVIIVLVVSGFCCFIIVFAYYYCRQKAETQLIEKSNTAAELSIPLIPIVSVSDGKSVTLPQNNKDTQRFDPNITPNVLKTQGDNEHITARGSLIKSIQNSTQVNKTTLIVENNDMEIVETVNQTKKSFKYMDEGETFGIDENTAGK